MVLTFEEVLGYHQNVVTFDKIYQASGAVPVLFSISLKVFLNERRQIRSGFLSVLMLMRRCILESSIVMGLLIRLQRKVAIGRDGWRPKKLVIEDMFSLWSDGALFSEFCTMCRRSAHSLKSSSNSEVTALRTLVNSSPSRSTAPILQGT
eukprot:gb/GEZJ01007162.1/.p1 GENE.gb/GEZJ01007162.1/~~gb/GEZJ01007162.1/.p1  ORF type:complete len:150 (+),score=7.79 gb/GEZJ01007162.1/:493-942(+)